jgi:enoyl-[acyl-carrier protein] reductase I
VRVCDVEKQARSTRWRRISRATDRLDGIVHSIAFASYAADRAERLPRDGARRLPARASTSPASPGRALQRAEGPLRAGRLRRRDLDLDDADGRGELRSDGPVKAALDSAIVFLAKSFSARGVRFNAVGAGPLKTASSAGIPGYLESYLYAESATLRKRALETGRSPTPRCSSSRGGPRASMPRRS